MGSPLFQRSELLIGHEAQDQLWRTRVILFGLGGVGSWCAEGLLRSGVGHLTLVDSDVVCITNVNRQLQATPAAVGKPKALELRRRLLEVNPDAEVVARQEVFGLETRDSFALESFDFIIDAVDSLSNKLGLIEAAMRSGRVLFTAMGASAKLDPTRIQVSSIWKTTNCPLARRIRKRLRRHGTTGDCLCVHSDELQPNHEESTLCGSERCLCPRTLRDDDGSAQPAHEWCSSKKRINGSLVHVTATFGMVLAGLVVQDVVRRCAGARTPAAVDPAGFPAADAAAAAKS
ncbi:MAG: tRNA threonylcarbamoyladenosine dehydratase [Pseudomonadota bacterium]